MVLWSTINSFKTFNSFSISNYTNNITRCDSINDNKSNNIDFEQQLPPPRMNRPETFEEKVYRKVMFFIIVYFIDS